MSTDSYHASWIAFPDPAHSNTAKKFLQSGHAVQPAWYVAICTAKTTAVQDEEKRTKAKFPDCILETPNANDCRPPKKDVNNVFYAATAYKLVGKYKTSVSLQLRMIAVLRSRDLIPPCEARPKLRVQIDRLTLFK